MKCGRRAGSGVQEAFAATVEENRAAGAADTQIVAGALPARRVVVTALRLHMIVVTIRLGHYAADRRRRRRWLSLPGAVTRPPTHASVKTAKATSEHVAHRAEVDQHQRDPRQGVDYGDQPTPNCARRNATVS